MNKNNPKNQKKAKKEYHFHVCGDHSWRHEGPKSECSLSNHAHCGNSMANDYAVCLKKTKIIAPPVERFSYKADANGLVILYKGEPVAKEGLTKKAQKADKRHHSTAKKDARQYQYSAQKLVAMLDDGNGPQKIWAKIRKVDKSLKTEAVSA